MTLLAERLDHVSDHAAQEPEAVDRNDQRDENHEDRGGKVDHSPKSSGAAANFKAFAATR